ncbi:MAG: LysM peptidoglycan-binding domain-containing protein [Coriobacteriales bacterium]|nr:LysM peptidoglycan-binding domain-containing protein [Coriobacteriales bacterium]
MRNIALVNGTSALATKSERHLRVVDGTRRAQRKRQEPCRRNDHSFFVGVCGIIVAIGLMSFILGDMARHNATLALSQARTEVVHVIYGDTLWNIAQRHAIPGCSTKDVLSWVMQHNDLSSARLRPGQCLVVPCAEYDLQEVL